jgi:hypothetical protein
MNYGYDAFKTLSKEGITKEASKLLRTVAEARNAKDKYWFRPIVFVCHDIGGTIVKQVTNAVHMESVSQMTASRLCINPSWIQDMPTSPSPPNGLYSSAIHTDGIASSIWKRRLHGFSFRVQNYPREIRCFRSTASQGPSSIAIWLSWSPRFF